MPKNEEYHLSKQVAQWLRYSYPHMIFHFDYAGLNLSIVQAKMMKEIQGARGYPDLFIAEPRAMYKGLFLELKRKDVKIFKQNKELIADPHVREQHEILLRLVQKGYYANFACGFEEAVKIINNYMAIK